MERPHDRASLLGDLSAGVTVAALVLPLSIGLAITAGLSAEQGLYASMLPLVAFAFIASSRHTMIGPDASVTAIIVASVVPIAARGGAGLSELVAALALASGLLCLVGAAVGAGRLAKVFVEATLIGYLAGLAVVVGLAQLPRIMKIPAPDEDRTLLAVVDTLSKVVDANWWSIALATGVITTIVVGRARCPVLPWMLIAIAAAAVTSQLLNLPSRGVTTIGTIAAGLPVPGIPDVAWSDVVAILPAAGMIALVTFADTMATATAFAARHHEPLESGRDLAGLGAADIVAGFVGGMPVSASGARTAAGDVAGGRTQLTGIVAAGAIALVVLVGGELIATLPIPALAGVVVAAVIPMVDTSSLARMRRLEKWHFRSALLVAVSVVVLGVLQGIVAALVVSIAERWFTRGAARPPARTP
jgi:MFS superfamily sulfate permease-like transporter